MAHAGTLAKTTPIVSTPRIGTAWPTDVSLFMGSGHSQAAYLS